MSTLNRRQVISTHDELYRATITSSPGGVRSIVMSMPVRLSIRITRKPHCQNSPIFIHVACGRGSVLLWRRCDRLCISGFVNDVVFSYHKGRDPESSTTLCLEEFARWRYRMDVRQLQCLVQFVRVRAAIARYFPVVSSPSAGFFLTAYSGNFCSIYTSLPFGGLRLTRSERNNVQFIFNRPRYTLLTPYARRPFQY